MSDINLNNYTRREAWKAKNNWSYTEGCACLMCEEWRKQLKEEQSMATTVTKERKTVITNPYATVVIKNGTIDYMKVCRPAWTEKGIGTLPPKEHEERNIEFKSWGDFCALVNAVKEVKEGVELELQG